MQIKNGACKRQAPKDNNATLNCNNYTILSGLKRILCFGSGFPLVTLAEVMYIKNTYHQFKAPEC